MKTQLLLIFTIMISPAKKLWIIWEIKPQITCPKLWTQPHTKIFQVLKRITTGMKIHGADNYCHLIVTLKWQYNLLVLTIKKDLVDLCKETWARKSLELSRKCWLPITIYRITRNWLIITIRGIRSCFSRLSMEKARALIQTILIWKISSRKNLKNWKIIS